MWKWVLVTAVLVGFGCAQDNAMTANRDRVLFTGTPAASGAPTDKKILLTDQALPDTVQYRVLGEIKVIRLEDHGYAPVYQALANKALDVGADAVINIGTWREPTTKTFGAPQGMGTAVKLEGKPDLSGIEGRWLGRGFVQSSQKQELGDSDISD